MSPHPVELSSVAQVESSSRLYDRAAMPWAVVWRLRPFWIKLRSKTLTIALNAVSKARFAPTPLRATSVGNV